MRLRSIVEEFVGNVECPICEGEGHVCETHPDKVWDASADGGCECGAGMPCKCTPYGIRRAREGVKA